LFIALFVGLLSHKLLCATKVAVIVAELFAAIVQSKEGERLREQTWRGSCVADEETHVEEAASVAATALRPVKREAAKAETATEVTKARNAGRRRRDGASLLRWRSSISRRALVVLLMVAVSRRTPWRKQANVGTFMMPLRRAASCSWPTSTRTKRTLRFSGARAKVCMKSLICLFIC
jgi:hypothetical protein